MTWPRVRFADLFRVKHGYAFKGEFFDPNGDFVLLTPGNFYETGGFRDQGVKQKRYQGDVPEGFVLDKGDVLVAMTEQMAGLLGSSMIVPESESYLHNQRLGKVVRIDEKRLDRTFLYHLFNTATVRHQISASASGTKVRHTSPDRIGEVESKIPPIGCQRRIVDILSGYDDLIENNRRRMALLEESARQLYQEWFVRLRFPGHEHTRIVNGVPEGWERRKLIDLCESVDYGYTASADRDEVGPRFLRITDIVPEFIDWSNVPFCPIKDDRLQKFLLREGDIVVARTGATVGYAKRLNKRHPEAVFASYLVRLRPRMDVDNLLMGVFVESESYKDYVKSHVGGSAQPNANAQVLAAAEMLVPVIPLQRDFRGTVEPMIDQREILQIQYARLRAVRDLFLPRLMSGEVAV